MNGRTLLGIGGSQQVWEDALSESERPSVQSHQAICEPDGKRGQRPVFVAGRAVASDQMSFSHMPLRDQLAAAEEIPSQEVQPRRGLAIGLAFGLMASVAAIAVVQIRRMEASVGALSVGASPILTQPKARKPALLEERTYRAPARSLQAPTAPSFADVVRVGRLKPAAASPTLVSKGRAAQRKRSPTGRPLEDLPGGAVQVSHHASEPASDEDPDSTLPPSVD